MWTRECPHHVHDQFHDPHTDDIICSSCALVLDDPLRGPITTNPLSPSRASRAPNQQHNHHHHHLDDHDEVRKVALPLNDGLTSSEREGRLHELLLDAQAALHLESRTLCDFTLATYARLKELERRSVGRSLSNAVNADAEVAVATVAAAATAAADSARSTRQFRFHFRRQRKDSISDVHPLEFSTRERVRMAYALWDTLKMMEKPKPLQDIVELFAVNHRDLLRYEHRFCIQTRPDAPLSVYIDFARTLLGLSFRLGKEACKPIPKLERSGWLAGHHPETITAASIYRAVLRDECEKRNCTLVAARRYNRQVLTDICKLLDAKPNSVRRVAAMIETLDKSIIS